MFSRTCSSSFEFIATGNGYTCEVADIYHKYKMDGIFDSKIDYRIGEMCIQVRGKDAFVIHWMHRQQQV